MDADELLDTLGYHNSESFLTPDRSHEAIEHAHGLRHLEVACADRSIRARFRGVYMLGVHRASKQRAATPVVLVCEAPDGVAADAIHQLTWNQGTAPFVMVHTPAGVRIYSGFDYELDDTQGPRRSKRGVIEPCVAFHQVADQLDALRAKHIDDGTLWKVLGSKVDPSKRVDARLLDELKKLGEWLSNKTGAGLKPSVAHALIGRFIYLRYLRERGILTNKRISNWKLDVDEVFGRKIKVRSFHALLEHVDEWLNGAIFPLSKGGAWAPRTEDVQRVAGVMLGDQVDGNLHLDFRAYDFSHIPIELLSSIYEQFIANEGRDEESGAYYTPIPLVNFVLGELDDMLPLGKGMKVFDPACGSGAFLVQCYQLLVERERQHLGRALTPRELRSLLVEHIYGLDREEGACQVTVFSLALALLDQIPTDVLARAENFKLPSLDGANIFKGDFFEDGPWTSVAKGFDWIVGNPPWKKGSAKVDAHQSALAWMKEREKTEPVCGNQLAQAFAWKASVHLPSDRPGMAALVMPAMTLFETQKSFRQGFFTRMSVPAVANLANLAEVLFHGRARLPASVIFYESKAPESPESIAVYSPMVLNQLANRAQTPGERQEVWAITVNHSEVKFLPRREVETGDALPWKTSMWGSHRDLRLLQDVGRRFRSLEEIAEGRFRIAQGVELKTLEGPTRGYVQRKELEGRRRLKLSALRSEEHVHSFSVSACPELKFHDTWLRERGGVKGIDVNGPPHIIVSAARTFAVYSGEFLVVPPRQIGIAGNPDDTDFLRALALYLGSSFVLYHQFLLSPELGVGRMRSTQDVLLKVPVPFAANDAASLFPWLELHTKLVMLSEKRWELLDPDLPARADVTVEQLNMRMSELEEQVDNLVSNTLGLHPHERWLVDDLVRVRMDLIQGKVGEAAAGPPDAIDLRQYANAIRDALDHYLCRGERFRHVVTVSHAVYASLVEIAFLDATRPHETRVVSAQHEEARALRSVRERIEQTSGQWMYFDRNLVMYLDERVYIFKPMQRVSWTRSQALADSDRIIKDLITAGARRA